MTRARNGLRWTALVMAGCATAALLVVFNPFASLLDSEAGGSEAERAKSELTTSTLSLTVEADGELQFVEQRILASTQAGALTAVADLGQTAAASTVLFEVNSTSTIALTGDVPAWRALTVDDVGADVAQLEANLVSLGYDPDGIMTVDQIFTDVTAALVEQWQEDVGFDQTGVVSFGQVAFVPEGAIVTSIESSTGQAMQGSDGTGQSTILTVSSNAREITFAVQAEHLDTIEIGTAVEARLPDRTTIAAAVTSLGLTADGSWLANAALTPGEDPAVLPSGESVPVTVSWNEVIATDVTTVRVNALTRLDSGIYALEVIEPDGSTSFVEVGLGARSGSVVELLTDLAPGTQVIAP